MIDEAKRLHALGFGVHWLKTKSKEPLEFGWTKGERKSWQELSESYRYGFNVGTRLGKASQLKCGNFLAVIDCDVKSSDPKHVAEMEKKLKELIGVAAPIVASGRGNGSKHVYIKTKTPVSPFRFSQSAEKVRVRMPSVKRTSRAEEAALTHDELKEGIRLRAAWEISVMGEGQQVVLPPSVHPDTGGSYVWINRSAEIPLMHFEQVEGEKDYGDALKDFKPVPVDLLGSTLSERVARLIFEGDGASDRSAALMSACLSLCKAGFSDLEILSLLSDPENYLGQVAYDHTQTKSRRQAAEWVRKYTLVKARRETSAANAFSDEAEIEKLTPELAKMQAAEILSADDWRSQLTRTKEEDSRPASTMRNVYLILVNEGAPDVIKRDEFAVSDFYGCDTVWGGVAGAEITDMDTVRIKAWLSQNYRFEPSDDKIEQAVLKIADENRFHPVRDFLDTLSWDGVPRLDGWLKTYLAASGPEPYLSAISRKTIVAMVSRALEPGCKFDQVLILEGKQGCGKSTTVRILAGDWFSDAHINFADKDSVLNMRSVWAMELGELSGMRKADVDQLKEFLSRQTDRMRAPYGVRSQNYPRQCIFIGTTNSTEYLKDTTGNRRFWPVKVGQLDREALTRDRDQLLAEALFLYGMGEPLYLEDEATNVLAQGEQDGRVFVDGLAEKLETFLERDQENFPTEEFSIMDLFSEFGPLANWRPGIAEQMRAGAALKAIGFEKIRSRNRSAKRMLWKRLGIPAGHTSTGHTSRYAQAQSVIKKG